LNIIEWIIIEVILFILLSIFFIFLSSRGSHLYEVRIKGKNKTWDFDFWSKDGYLDDWEKDGLEISVITGSSPVWIYNIGLHNVLFWLQKHHIIPLE
jgi:hypothetical protein